MSRKNSEQIWKEVVAGDLGNMIAGPCAVESWEQLDKIAAFFIKQEIKVLRAGAYKPRTSPKSFQGLGQEGIAIIHEICAKYNLISVTEIMDMKDLNGMEGKIDILQVGSRNMYNYSMLKELGRLNQPVLLKRGLMATMEEFVNAAEYIRGGGNKKVIMCERGIRTFETETRNTLDLSCVALLKHQTDYPVVADLSHSLGRKDIMAPMAKAALAAGADMLMLEVHPNPERALSDAKQQLTLSEFHEIMEQIEPKREKRRKVYE